MKNIYKKRKRQKIEKDRRQKIEKKLEEDRGY